MISSNTQTLRVVVIIGLMLTVAISHAASDAKRDPNVTNTWLVMGALAKEYTAKPGEMKHTFSFTVSNDSTNEMVIDDVQTSCGCTIARIPRKPWILAPSAREEFGIIVDLQGRRGVVVKNATIIIRGNEPMVITMKVTIPSEETDVMNPDVRTRNQKIGMADRQAVFKGDCASCHSVPTMEQMGAGLYLTACAICHDAEHRAAIVPDLRAVPQKGDRNFWRQIIAHGIPRTLMPAFSHGQGGPLSAEQINSLTEYLIGTYLRRDLATSEFATPVQANDHRP